MVVNTQEQTGQTTLTSEELYAKIYGKKPANMTQAEWLEYVQQQTVGSGDRPGWLGGN